jgi:hypothetical protein
MASPSMMETSRTRDALYVMTGIVKTPMRLCSVMDVIWLCTKNAMVCHSFLKVNGCAENANCLAETLQ